MLTSKNKVIVYAQDAFSSNSAKTAVGFIKYGLSKTVGIVDRKLAGKRASDIYKGLLPVPIYNSIDIAKKSNPDADVLLIGIAPAGGKFPKEWLGEIKKAISYKLNIVNGLHDFLNDIDEIRSLANKNNVFVWDVRDWQLIKQNLKTGVANGLLLNYPIKIVLTVGTDAAIGKMTVALELTKSAKLSGKSATFVATGQTGIMISGSGAPIDAITGDFMAAAIEEELIKASKRKYEIAFIEGQGSILHPAWSGVTLALLHGALPHKLILCHKVGREYLKNTKVKIGSLNEFINIYESISLPLRKAKVVGIGLNTYELSKRETSDAIKKIEDETGLIASDPVKETGEKLLRACLG
ncbi:MAG: DUF1611 domain-containing protein [Candidatus Melainabacteria bacterium]|nr:DUF1611 domain-containing protein [Candidatus Melainabacteria bacterium]